MEDLEGDPAAVGVDRPRDHPVRPGGPRRREPAPERRQPPLHVRREAAGDDQPDAAPRALGEVGGEAREGRPAVLEPGVHRAHQDPVRERREAEVEGRQEVRVRGRHGSSSRSGRT